MSDKNRLEEIEKEVQQSRLDLERDDTINILELDKVEWVLKYAKEQAERVQELEDIIYQDERQAVLEGLYEENKRYRELLEKVDYLLEKAGEADEDIYDLVRHVRTSFIVKQLKKHYKQWVW